MIKPGYSARTDWTLTPESTAVLLVDVQNSELSADTRASKPEYCQRIQNVALPNQKKLLECARSKDIEVTYTVIESLTRDGRDRCLDHKLSQILIPKGSDFANVIQDVAPDEDDMVFPKTSSGVFNSTNIDYVLRNLGVKSLLIGGFLTDQCVDMAVRDAADKGYFVICVDDACATHTEQRHQNAISAFSGYCQVMSTNEVIEKLKSL